MVKQKKKILTIIAISLVSVLFILPTIGFGILNWGVLPPKKLTPLVIQQANKFLDAHLECERIELTYFETYPYLGVKLSNGRLISHIKADSTLLTDSLEVPADSLLSFRQATVSLQPLDYLFKNKITIKDVSIDYPRFYGYISPEGRPNWNIYENKSDTSTTSGDSDIPLIDLQRVRISNGRFTYNDEQNHLFTEVNGFFLSVDGSLTSSENTLDIEAGTSSILFSNPAYNLKNDLKLQFKSQIKLADHYRSIMLNGAELRINELPFTANGSIHKIPESGLSHIDMEMDLTISDLNDLLKFIPDTYFQNRDKTVAKGSIILSGSINGLIGDSIMPNINLCCKIDDGSYHIKGMKQGIETLKMDLDLFLNGTHPDSSFLTLGQLLVEGANTSLNMQGNINNILENPYVDTHIKGMVDFTRLGEDFLNPDTLLVEGILDADLKAAFSVNELLTSQPGKMKASGKLSIDKLKALSEPLGLNLFISGTQLVIDSTRQQNQYLGKKDLLKVSLEIDSLNLQYKDEINTNISQFGLEAQTTPTLDTTAVIPMTGKLHFSQLQTQLPDSVWFIAGKTVLQGAIKPSATNKRTPTVGAQISVDTLKYISRPLSSGMVLTGSVFNIEALPYKDVRNQTRQMLRQNGDTLLSRPRNMRIKMDSAAHITENSAQQLLRQWEARGNVSFGKLQLFSRYLPLQTWMDPTTVKFNTNNITLTNANLHLGKSDLTLSGEISKIRQAMLRNGKLKGEFKLTSDFIDCTQLMQAINAGMLYAETQTAATQDSIMHESLSTIESQTLTAEVASSVDSTTQLFIVPEFLDITLYTDAKRIDFKDLTLENVSGEIVMRDQSINLNKLDIQSNMGQGNLTMVYTAKDKEEATTGFDLDMKKVQIDGLISLFPSIDTLVPMLRSFEGVVDCEITATCKLDSSMSILLPTLNAACFLEGQNMVLLDGETFTEISKTLMFKNKKRNVIDSISVDLSIKDNKIEVFPFQVEVDRYRVAVGGTHHLDMTFNYHISVLKSPVPFKLGIDITGDLDDFKYKITKCKYKDLFKPAKMAEMDSTRKNIRKEIRDAVRKQIEQSAPELGI